MRNKIVTFVVCFVAGASAALTISADHADAVYSPGEEAVFTIGFGHSTDGSDGAKELSAWINHFE